MVKKKAPPKNQWTQAPVNVSPLIKLSRWSMLIAGIVYGATNHYKFSQEEKECRKIDGEKKKIRDAILAEEKKKQVEIEREALEALSGSKPKH